MICSVDIICGRDERGRPVSAHPFARPTTAYFSCITGGESLAVDTLSRLSQDGLEAIQRQDRAQCNAITAILVPGSHTPPARLVRGSAVRARFVVRTYHRAGVVLDRDPHFLLPRTITKPFNGRGDERRGP